VSPGLARLSGFRLLFQYAATPTFKLVKMERNSIFFKKEIIAHHFSYRKQYPHYSIDSGIKK
jgi:hypothetical protein